MYEEDFHNKLKRELERFKAHMDEFDRTVDTHWPVIDAYAEMAQEEMAHVITGIMDQGTMPDIDVMMQVYTRILERAFWIGYKFAKTNDELSSCPSKHDGEPAHRPFDPRMN
jgi:hypothetical protein